ncbi:hypothetical protein MMC07_009262 [Pseudocyphellaria aurata]|nr:hypothetical protein [Pseudocyphellaria aurata]
MLGRLRMSIDDCIRDYENFGQMVFGHSRRVHVRTPLFWPRDKYDEKVLEAVVRDVVERNVPHVATFPGGRNFAFDENRCRTVVLSYQQQKNKAPEMPYIFRTYKKNLHESEDTAETLVRNPGLAQDVPIWQVARATSAAPSYLAPLKIGDLEYMDGGMGANNPCEELYHEVRRMNNKSDTCVRVILSVGTGKNNKTARRFSGKSQGLSRYWNYLNWAKKWATDSEQVHMRMLNWRGRDKFQYFRLNVDTGLDKMKLDEWRCRGALRTTAGKAIKSLRSLQKSSQETSNGNNKPVNEASAAEVNVHPPARPKTTIPVWLQPKNRTLELIRKKTNTYLARNDVKLWLENCAKILVDMRRERVMNDRHRWEKTCFSAWYQCQVEGCQRAEKEYDHPEAFRCHLKDKHCADFTEAAVLDKTRLDDYVKKCKIVVL